MHRLKRTTLSGLICMGVLADIWFYYAVSHKAIHWSANTTLEVLYANGFALLGNLFATPLKLLIMLVARKITTFRGTMIVVYTLQMLAYLLIFFLLLSTSLEFEEHRIFTDFAGLFDKPYLVMRLFLDIGILIALLKWVPNNPSAPDHSSVRGA